MNSATLIERIPALSAAYANETEVLAGVLAGEIAEQTANALLGFKELALYICDGVLKPLPDVAAEFDEGADVPPAIIWPILAAEVDKRKNLEELRISYVTLATKRNRTPEEDQALDVLRQTCSVLRKH